MKSFIVLNLFFYTAWNGVAKPYVVDESALLHDVEMTVPALLPWKKEVTLKNNFKKFLAPNYWECIWDGRPPTFRNLVTFSTNLYDPICGMSF